ncbi:MAG: LysM peptidoglycan-binding domain-containing protein [Bacteroidia bacterium]
MEVSFAAATDKGQVRSHNEDFYLHQDIGRGEVFLVCDGMGGHNAGEVAARLAAESIVRYLQEAPKDFSPRRLLEESILYAHQQIRALSAQQGAYEGMGTTVAALLVLPDGIWYAHVGDSRIYAYEKEKLTLLTRDDSLVEELYSQGLLTKSQAENHPEKNILTQALGQLQGSPQVHIASYGGQASLFLLCTDGITNLLTLEEMQAILQAPSLLPQKVEAFIHTANLKGGYDNVTVMLVSVTPPRRTNLSIFAYMLKNKSLLWVVAGGVVLSLGVILYFNRPAPSMPEAPIIIEDSTALDSTLLIENPSPAPVEVDQDTAPLSTPPEPAPQPTAQPTAQPPKNPQKAPLTYTYQVEKGDNLTRLAKLFHTSRQKIAELNNLKDYDEIRAGQKLKIPIQKKLTHKVEKGQTLSQIARRYHTSVELLRYANGLEDKDNIRQGQEIVVIVPLKK